MSVLALNESSDWVPWKPIALASTVPIIDAAGQQQPWAAINPPVFETFDDDDYGELIIATQGPLVP